MCVLSLQKLGYELHKPELWQCLNLRTKKHQGMKDPPVGREVECERVASWVWEIWTEFWRDIYEVEWQWQGRGDGDLEWGTDGKRVLAGQTFCDICEIGHNPHTHTHTQIDLFGPLWICITKNLYISIQDETVNSEGGIWLWIASEKPSINPNIRK